MKLITIAFANVANVRHLDGQGIYRMKFPVNHDLFQCIVTCHNLVSLLTVLTVASCIPKMNMSSPRERAIHKLK